jgi:hypothetical protein
MVLNGGIAQILSFFRYIKQQMLGFVALWQRYLHQINSNDLDGCIILVQNR